MHEQKDLTDHQSPASENKSPTSKPTMKRDSEDLLELKSLKKIQNAFFKKHTFSLDDRIAAYRDLLKSITEQHIPFLNEELKESGAEDKKSLSRQGDSKSARPPGFIYSKEVGNPSFQDQIATLEAAAKQLPIIIEQLESQNKPPELIKQDSKPETKTSLPLPEAEPLESDKDLKPDFDLEEFKLPYQVIQVKKTTSKNRKKKLPRKAENLLWDQETPFSYAFIEQLYQESGQTKIRVVAVIDCKSKTGPLHQINFGGKPRELNENEEKKKEKNKEQHPDGSIKVCKPALGFYKQGVKPWVALSSKTTMLATYKPRKGWYYGRRIKSGEHDDIVYPQADGVRYKPGSEVRNSAIAELKQKVSEALTEAWLTAQADSAWTQATFPHISVTEIPAGRSKKKSKPNCGYEVNITTYSEKSYLTLDDFLKLSQQKDRFFSFENGKIKVWRKGPKSREYFDLEFEIDDCFFIIAQLFLALFFLNEKGILHRDLKELNILLEQTFQIKLTDFASAKDLHSGLFDSEYDGTVSRYSPEIMLGRWLQLTQTEIPTPVTFENYLALQYDRHAFPHLWKNNSFDLASFREHYPEWNHIGSKDTYFNVSERIGIWPKTFHNSSLSDETYALGKILVNFKRLIDKIISNLNDSQINSQPLAKSLSDKLIGLQNLLSELITPNQGKKSTFCLEEDRISPRDALEKLRDFFQKCQNKKFTLDTTETFLREKFETALGSQSDEDEKKQETTDLSDSAGSISSDQSLLQSKKEPITSHLRDRTTPRESFTDSKTSELSRASLSQSRLTSDSSASHRSQHSTSSVEDNHEEPATAVKMPPLIADFFDQLDVATSQFPDIEHNIILAKNKGKPSTHEKSAPKRERTRALNPRMKRLRASVERQWPLLAPLLDQFSEPEKTFYMKAIRIQLINECYLELPNVKPNRKEKSVHEVFDDWVNQFHAENKPYKFVLSRQQFEREKDDPNYKVVLIEKKQFDPVPGPGQRKGAVITNFFVTAYDAAGRLRQQIPLQDKGHLDQKPFFNLSSKRGAITAGKYQPLITALNKQLGFSSTEANPPPDPERYGFCHNLVEIHEAYKEIRHQFSRRASLSNRGIHPSNERIQSLLQRKYSQWVELRKGKVACDETELSEGRIEQVQNRFAHLLVGTGSKIQFLSRADRIARLEAQIRLALAKRIELQEQSRQTTVSFQALLLNAGTDPETMQLIVNKLNSNYSDPLPFLRTMDILNLSGRLSVSEVADLCFKLLPKVWNPKVPSGNVQPIVDCVDQLFNSFTNNYIKEAKGINQSNWYFRNQKTDGIHRVKKLNHFIQNRQFAFLDDPESSNQTNAVSMLMQQILALTIFLKYGTLGKYTDNFNTVSNTNNTSARMHLIKTLQLGLNANDLKEMSMDNLFNKISNQINYLYLTNTFTPNNNNLEIKFPPHPVEAKDKEEKEGKAKEENSPQKAPAPKESSTLPKPAIFPPLSPKLGYQGLLQPLIALINTRKGSSTFTKDFEDLVGFITDNQAEVIDHFIKAERCKTSSKEEKVKKSQAETRGKSPDKSPQSEAKSEQNQGEQKKEVKLESINRERWGIDKPLTERPPEDQDQTLITHEERKAWILARIRPYCSHLLEVPVFYGKFNQLFTKNIEVKQTPKKPLSDLLKPAQVEDLADEKTQLLAYDSKDESRNLDLLVWRGEFWHNLYTDADQYLLKQALIKPQLLIQFEKRLNLIAANKDPDKKPDKNQELPELKDEADKMIKYEAEFFKLFEKLENTIDQLRQRNCCNGWGMFSNASKEIDYLNKLIDRMKQNIEETARNLNPKDGMTQQYVHDVAKRFNIPISTQAEHLQRT